MSNSLTGPFYASLNISHVVNGLCGSGSISDRSAPVPHGLYEPEKMEKRKDSQLVHRTSHAEHVVKRWFVLTEGQKRTALGYAAPRTLIRAAVRSD